MCRSMPDRRKTPIGTFLQPTRTPPRSGAAVRMNNIVRPPEHLLAYSFLAFVVLATNYNILLQPALLCAVLGTATYLQRKGPDSLYSKVPALLCTHLPRGGLLGNQRGKEKADPHPRPSPRSESSSRTFVPLALLLHRPDPAGLPGSSRAAYEPLHLIAGTEVP